MMTPQARAMLQMTEPVYAVASPVYVVSTVGRVCLAANREGLVKQGLPQSAPGLHETIQSALGKPRATVEIVQVQMYHTADFEGVTGV